MLKEKWEQFTQKVQGNNKRKIENLVIFIIILIVTILVINSIWNGDTKKKDSGTKNETGKTLSQSNVGIQEENDTSRTQSSELEQKLESILTNIEGVGKVNVLITYSETSKKMALYNEDQSESNTEESDTNGGSRKVSETNHKKEVIFQEVDGEKQPVTQSIITPVAEGAIVTAEGASDSNVKMNIMQAVEAVTGLATHKIQVFEMKKQ